MSWRIEHTDPLTLLRELPGEWVQTCIALAPCGAVSVRTLAVLAEVHRLLREDGALWVFLPSETLRGELTAAGWVEHAPPSWAAPLALRDAGVRPLALLTKRPSYFRRSASLVAQGPRAFPRRRRADCHPDERCEQRRAAVRGLARRCVLSTTAPVACGTCGAPYTLEAPGERRSTCVHRNPSGRCLVLDPFYRAGHGTLEAAHHNGRSFLGIVDAGTGGERP